MWFDVTSDDLCTGIGVVANSGRAGMLLGWIGGGPWNSMTLLLRENGRARFFPSTPCCSTDSDPEALPFERGSPSWPKRFCLPGVPPFVESDRPSMFRMIFTVMHCCTEWDKRLSQAPNPEKRRHLPKSQRAKKIAHPQRRYL